MTGTWVNRVLFAALAALSVAGALHAPAARAEQAERLVWHGTWPWYDHAPEANYITSTRGDAYAFIERRMRERTFADYSRCGVPNIYLSAELDRTGGSGLLSYWLYGWRFDYISGAGCDRMATADTAGGGLGSYNLLFETGPTEERTCKTANPVQPGSGRKRFTETDYTGAGAHPLTLTRHYSSRWTDSAVATGLAPIAAWDGGWRHAYQASLTQRSDGSLRALRPDGSMLGLTASATVANTWTAAGSRDSVTALVDAVGTRTGYTYTAAADDSTETYDAAGKLLNIKQRNGWLTTLTYSDATTPTTIAPRPGLLTSVKNQFGRELKFTYDSQGRLAELLPPGAISGQPAGSTTSPIRYVYNEPASLGPGVPAQSQLTSVVWQDGSIKRYHHEDGRWPQAVTGITDEAGVRYGSYAYDAQGRVTRSELSAGAERLDFAYATDANGKPTTTVTDYTGAGGTANDPQLHLHRHRQRQIPRQPHRPVQPVRQHAAGQHLRRTRQPDQADRPRRQRHLHRLRRQGPRNRTRYLPEQLQHRHHAPGTGQRDEGHQHQVARHVQPADASRRAQQDNGQQLQQQRHAHGHELDGHDRRHGGGQVHGRQDR